MFLWTIDQYISEATLSCESRLTVLMPPPNRTMLEYKEIVREVQCLASVLQGTMSLEGEGLSRNELHKIKLKMARRLIQVST